MVINKNNKAIWGTRIKRDASTLFQKIGNSIEIDKKLYKEDIKGSIVHVEMLFKQKIISFKIIFSNLKLAYLRLSHHPHIHEVK